MFKKKIEFSEKDAALKEMLAARNELERARQMFNYATNEYFEIANTELTIAELKYNVAFTKLKKGKKLIPDAFLETKNIEEIRGIYIPFWFFDCEIEGTLNALTEQKNRTRGFNATIITTKYYNVSRNGKISYNKVPIDGSTHFQDHYK
jgi:hypothetical protein